VECTCGLYICCILVVHTCCTHLLVLPWFLPWLLCCCCCCCCWLFVGHKCVCCLLTLFCEFTAHRDLTFKKFFYLANPTREYGDGKKVFSHALGTNASGQTIELCFAQYWSSLGDSSVAIEVQFRTGVFPSNSHPTLVAGEGFTKIDVRNPTNGSTVLIKPTGKLTKWTRVLMPTSFKVTPPNVQSRVRQWWRTGWTMAKQYLKPYLKPYLKQAGAMLGQHTI
jgi:hypothetical protein